MTLRRRFNAAGCLAVLLAVLAYCAAEENAVLGAAGVAACALAWWMGQGAVRRQLPRIVVNLLVLTAIFNAAVAVSRSTTVVSDLSQFLVYIQLIKLFDRQSVRDDAQLLTLSVFVAIGAILTSNALMVGLLLAAFTPTVMVAAMLLQLGWGLEGAGAASADEHGGAEPAPLMGRACTRDLSAVAGSATIMAGALAVVAFVLTPRGLGEGVLGVPFGALHTRPTVGFTGHVRLGVGGLLSRSETPVMDLTVRDANGRDIGEQMGTLYLRGAVNDRYEPRDGAWTDSGTGRRSVAETMSSENSDGEGKPVDCGPRQPMWLSRPGDGQGGGGAVLTQEITLRNADPLRHPLFALWRPVRVEPRRDDRLLRPGPDLTIWRDRSSGGSAYEYTVVSTPDPGEQAVDPDRAAALGFKSGRVHGLAERVLGERGIGLTPAARGSVENRGAANAIQAYLRKTCSYTLEMIAPEAREDPIEMFLTRTQRGHCEYFASAMAAMCQSVGLDARIVLGYLCSERSSATGRFTVRESDAHAWVEVMLAPGRWQPFDPSPPAEVERLRRGSSGLLAWLRRAYESIEMRWNSTVVGFDEQRRERLLGSGAAESATADNSTWVWRAAVRIWRGVLEIHSVWDALPWVVGALALATLVMAEWRIVRGAIGRWLVGESSRTSAAAGSPELKALLVQAAFYGTTLTALKRGGLGKPRWRPPGLHAQVLAAQDAALAYAVEGVAGLYYKVRFGRRALSEAEAREARLLVEQVKNRLREARGRA